MEWLILIIVGLFGGIVGGMGMGGGTLLIPIMTLYLEIPQLEAQMINLVAFIPMAAVSLIIHFKNKLVDTKKIWYVLPSALIFAVIGALMSAKVDKEVLRAMFGSFMIIISIMFLLKMAVETTIKSINFRNSPNLLKKTTYYVKIFTSNIK